MVSCGFDSHRPNHIMTKKSEHEIYLGYSESRSGGGIRPGEEDMAYAQREDSYIDFTPDGLYIKPAGSQETIDVDFNPTEYVNENVYMVLVRYRDGDTFGCTHGNWYIEGVYLDAKKAQRISRQISTNKYKGEYLPWEGYFSSLESVEVWGTTVRDGECCGIKWF